MVKVDWYIYYYSASNLIILRLIQLSVRKQNVKALNTKTTYTHNFVILCIAARVRNKCHEMM